MEDVNLIAYAPPDLPRPALRLLPPLDRVEPRGVRLAVGAGAVLFALAYFGFIFQYWAPAHPGTDQNGYLVGGKMLAWTGSTGFKPAEPMGFVGTMWVRNDATGINYPKYPVGLPLLYAIVLWTCGRLGPTAAFLVSPVGAAAAVLGTYFLTRRFAGTFASFMAMLVMAFGQVMLVLSDNPNSHASCVAFCVWGVFLLIGFWETGSPWRGVLAGFLIGFAGTIRYTEGLLGLLIGVAALSMLAFRDQRGPVRSVSPIIGCLALITFPVWKVQILNYLPGPGPQLSVLETIKSPSGIIAIVIGLAITAWLIYREPRSYFNISWPVLGWLIPVGYLVGFNLIAMHTPTGYDTTNESVPGSAFTPGHIVMNWEKLIRQLHDTGLFFVLPLGMLGMGLALRATPRRAALLWLWLVPGTLTYMAYYWAPERGVAYLRFFLTLMPPIVVGAGVLIDQVIASSVTRWQRAASSMACGLVVAGACSMSLYRSLLGIEDGQETGQGMEAQFRQQVNLAALADVVTRTAPAGSVVIAASQQINDLQFVGDYDCYDNEYFTSAFATRLRGQQERLRDTDPDPIQPARRNFMLAQVNGKTDEQLGQMQIDIVRRALDGGKRAFIVCRRDQTAAYTRRYERRDTGLTWKTRAFYHDLPRLRPPEDPATPADPVRTPGPGNGPGNGNGRRGPGGFGGNRPPAGGGLMRRGGVGFLRDFEPPTQSWQVIEILKRPT